MKKIIRVTWSTNTRVHHIHFEDGTQFDTTEFGARQYLMKNFDDIDKDFFSQHREGTYGQITTGGSLSFWKPILDAHFGTRDWAEGIHNNSYNTHSSGWISSFSGEKLHEDIGIVVFGTSSYGDAYYGYDGSIRWKFLI